MVTLHRTRNVHYELVRGAPVISRVIGEETVKLLKRVEALIIDQPALYSMTQCAVRFLANRWAFEWVTV